MAAPPHPLLSGGLRSPDPPKGAPRPLLLRLVSCYWNEPLVRGMCAAWGRLFFQSFHRLQTLAQRKQLDPSFFNVFCFFWISRTSLSAWSVWGFQYCHYSTRGSCPSCSVILMLTATFLAAGPSSNQVDWRLEELAGLVGSQTWNILQQRRQHRAKSCDTAKILRCTGTRFHRTGAILCRRGTTICCSRKPALLNRIVVSHPGSRR